MPVDRAREKARKAAYYQKHKTRILARNRAWAKQNKARLRRYQRAWYAKNRDRIRRQKQTCHKSRPDVSCRALKKYRNRAEYRKAHKQAEWRRRGYPMPTRPMPPCCECCGEAPQGRVIELQLDHCHETGKFRGWLCMRCNTAIGKLGDNLAGIQRAVTYLERAE